MTMKKKSLIFKCIAVMIIIFMIVIFGACGNHSIGLGNYTFTKVHIITHNGHSVCLTVEKWYQADVGIEVKTKEYGTLWLSEGMYMLCEHDCPICAAEAEQENKQ